MTSALSIVLTLAFIVVVNCVDPPLPVWPPVPEFRVSIKYTPGLYDTRLENLSGTYYYSTKQNRYAVESRDSLRTSEKAIFQEDKKNQYVLMKFGEFKWNCKLFKNDEFTKGNVSYVPPFGLDAKFFKESKYTGQTDCGSSKCDTYVYTKDKRTVTASFNVAGDRTLVKIEDAEGDLVRSAEFDAYQPGNQDPKIFEVPSDVQCK
jgi:hypothetical protein